MTDILYQASVFFARRSIVDLPGGWDIGENKYIQYHYYNIDGTVDAGFRLEGARERIAVDGGKPMPPEIADHILAMLLGAATITHSADGTPMLNVNEGELAQMPPSVRAEIARATLPFSDNSLMGKTIAEIAKSPAASGIFIVNPSTRSSGNPVAVIVTASGIVAIHIAVKAAPIINAWVNGKLKKWLK